ncbi:SDR family oxidoreductase [Halanaeroarchaeum sulfurireducens]|uniref:3-oxoacyl-(Acyl-carrier-protein) reductase n=1 Tax=Halanaeroarchaeum sulfurireducens TaxID=1604004 RepID=A0A0F7PG36_9EURY|nr:SDR family oxidoreductase [Halanaeroarchaeum sulfurireducens]AKH98549.1 3-oxoacyl-(acyl-carrier-protein) reductase [Halanaeroarchaeum sulfurireducens]
MDLQLDGNAALVTASSSGLGKASAKALAREGADVVINGRDEKRLAEARDEVAAVAAGEVVAQPADLTDAAAVEALVERTVEAFGGLDHLVTSAGGPPSGAFLDTDDDDWYAAFDLLVMSVVRLARAAEPHLREGEGTIVNITSRSVKEALDSLVLSNSVRMSVIGLEKTLSQEFAPEIRANAVLPGPHETARIRELVEAAVERGEVDSYEAGLDDWANNPLDRIGDPMELGDVVAFLSSPASGFVNGAAIPVDGGATGSNL